MSFLSIRTLAIGLLLTSGLLAACTSTAKDVFKGVDRIVAVGDLHGDYDQYIEVLTTNGLVDEQLRWQGGKTHFVQLGDVVDRGPDSLRIIRHLMKLEKEARKKGGRVHVLIGNHEVMNIQNDLRYVHPGEYSALIAKNSDAVRARYIEAVYKHRISIDPALATNPDLVMDGLKKEFPLGYVEHRTLWEPGQEMAKWVASRNTVIRINDSLFVHGGMNPHGEYQKLSKINRLVRKQISASFAGAGISNSPDGPLWYRGLAKNGADVELAPLLKMLEFYEVSRIFIAHTPTQGAILTRLDGKVIMIDVGISKHYGGSLANVVIEDGVLQVMHRGTLVPFPGNDLPLQEYLEIVSELEPADSRLRRYVNLLDNQVSREKEIPPSGGAN